MTRLRDDLTSAEKATSAEPAPAAAGAKVAPTPVHGIQRLQRAAGNRVVLGVLAGPSIQRKLVVGPADDPAELEADRMAALVVHRLARPGRQVEELDEAGGPVKARRRLHPSHVVDGSGGDVEPALEARIQSARGGGQRLPEDVQTSMESGFAARFDSVRVHTGVEADALNQALGARAFTSGPDIFFSRGYYEPGSGRGQELLAHELAHTVQQGAVDRPADEPARRRRKAE